MTTLSFTPISRFHDPVSLLAACEIIGPTLTAELSPARYLELAGFIASARQKKAVNGFENN